MTGIMDNSTTPAPFKFKIASFDSTRIRRPSSFVGIPEAFLILIGHVVGVWSQFDISFNNFLSKLLNASAIENKKWEFKSFKDRSSLFIKACNALFEEHQTILNAVKKIITDAKELQIDRNLISHGHILIKVETFEVEDNKIPGVLSLHCIGQKSGKRIEREYSYEKLESIRYELAHLCGRMGAILKGENLDKLEIVQPDIDALRVILVENNNT